MIINHLDSRHIHICEQRDLTCKQAHTSKWITVLCPKIITAINHIIDNLLESQLINLANSESI